MHHPTDRITHTTAFVTPVVEHWLEREIVAVWRSVCSLVRVDYVLVCSSLLLVYITLHLFILIYLFICLLIYYF